MNKVKDTIYCFFVLATLSMLWWGWQRFFSFLPWDLDYVAGIMLGIVVPIWSTVDFMKRADKRRQSEGKYDAEIKEYNKLLKRYGGAKKK